MSERGGDTIRAVGEVVRIEPGDPRWNRYAERHKRAYAYHLSEWSAVLGGAYGGTPRYLASVDGGGELRGVLPLMETKGVVFGRRLRSLPVVPTAGPIGATIEDEVDLLKAACEIARSTEAQAVVIQSRREGYTELVPGLVERPKHPTWITPLPRDPEELRSEWRSSAKNLYRSVNKAEKAGMRVRESGSEADLRSFYRLYLATMKAHHSLPRRYLQLQRARELLGPRGVFRLFVVEHEGRVVAGGVFHAFNGTIELHYNASDARALNLRPNHALYWHVIRWAIDQGLERFDWGEAKPGTSLESFKAQWSAERTPEYRYDWVGDEKASQATALRQAGNLGRSGGASRREQLIAAVWDRSPLRLTRAAGALVYRFL